MRSGETRGHAEQRREADHALVADRGDLDALAARRGRLDDERQDRADREVQVLERVVGVEEGLACGQAEWLEPGGQRPQVRGREPVEQPVAGAAGARSERCNHCSKPRTMKPRGCNPLARSWYA
jgi:hypothetical protein